MRFLSTCSGIEAATVAFSPLGWKCGAVAEIEPFPCAVLHHHYGVGAPLFMPDPAEEGISEHESRRRLVKAKRNSRLGPAHEAAPLNYGDLTRFKEWPDDRFDGLWGGTPCQSFSIAGLRKGLDDPRGNLSLIYAAIARKYRTLWVGWENVPGVLSSGGGDDFRCFLSALAGWDIPLPEGGWKNSGIITAGPAPDDYGLAWRVLDAQYFGVPQRRRRVIVIGHLGDWRPAAAVLFERHSLCGNPAPGRETGQKAAPTISARTRGGGGLGTDAELDGALIAETMDASFARARGAGQNPGQLVPDVSPALKARDYKGPSSDGDGDGAPLIVHPLKGEGFDGSEDGTGRGIPLVPALVANGDAHSGFRDEHGLVTAFDSYNQTVDSEVTHSIRSGAGLEGIPIAFDTTQITSAANYSEPKPGDPCHPLAAGAHAPAVAFNLRGREGGAMPEADDLASLRAADGGSSRSYIASAPPRHSRFAEVAKAAARASSPERMALSQYQRRRTNICMLAHRCGGSCRWSVSGCRDSPMDIPASRGRASRQKHVLMDRAIKRWATPGLCRYSLGWARGSIWWKR